VVNGCNYLNHNDAAAQGVGQAHFSSTEQQQRESRRNAPNNNDSSSVG